MKLKRQLSSGSPKKLPGPELESYRISPKTIELLSKQGITSLFPIQQSTFDLIYDKHDIMGRDLTGSGKTLAYCLPLVERMRQQKLIEVGKKRTDRSPLIIIMVPTRELVIQVNNMLSSIKHENEYQSLGIYGGAAIEGQIEGLRRGVEIVVGTTGRLLDHLERGTLKLSSLQCIILDEADRMLDMGFQEDVEKIFEYIHGTKGEAKADSPQCLLFSATFPIWVKRVAGKYLKPNYGLIDLAKDLTNKTVSTVKHLAIFCPYFNRMSILADIILCYGGTFGKTIVFTQTKAEANELYLSEKLKDIEVLHGDIPQQQREITFKGFKEGRFHILVATDVASRGLDIPNVDLIVQCEPPKDVETYIHRSGRTARAGKEGTVVTFYAKKHAPLLTNIEKTAGISFTKIGAPQPEDIISASSKFIAEGLKKVTDDALPLFNDTADLLVNEFGERKALLLTLAYISGNLNKIKKRSLLSGTEEFVTYQLETANEFRTVSYVWGILRRLMDPLEAEQIRQMRCYKNLKGAAFDVPEKLIPKFEAAYEQEKAKGRHMSYTIKRAQELPDLKDFEQGTFEKRNNTYDNNNITRREKSYNVEKSQGKIDNLNEIFMWELKTEEDVKGLLIDNNIGWKKVKVLMNDKGESKLVSFVTVDEDQVGDTLKLNGIKVKGLPLYYPAESGIIISLEDYCDLLSYTLDSVKFKLAAMDNLYLVMAESPLRPSNQRKELIEHLFETVGVSGLIIYPSNVLSLYATGKSTGLILDSGESLTTSLGIHDETICLPSLLQVSFGGRDLNKKLEEILLTKYDIGFSNSAERETVRWIKERYCKFPGERSTEKDNMSITLPDGKMLEIALSDLYKVPESLFNASTMEKVLKNFLGFTSILMQSVEKCDMETRPQLLRNIIIAGGNTCFENIEERLRDEVSKLVPVTLKAEITVTAKEDRGYAAWKGGSIIAKISSFKSQMKTLQQYKELGFNGLFKLI